MKLRIRESKYSKRYFVTDDDFIPLRNQPERGYTSLQAVERAQREASQDAKFFNISVSDAAKYYHIVDDELNHCPNLDKGI